MFASSSICPKTSDVFGNLNKRVQENRQRKVVLSIFFVILSTLFCKADPPVLPFEVSNLSHKKWSSEEALRIYDAACALVARSVNAERPPHLHPKFRLVLGAEADEIVRTDTQAEIHLKNWDADKFAEAAAIMAARDLVQGVELRSIAHQSVVTAHATASVADLQEHH